MRSITTPQKSNIQLVLTGVMVLLIGSFLLVMGLIILDAAWDNTATHTSSIANESFAPMTDVASNVARIGDCLFQAMTVSACINATGGEVIPSTNYTTTTGGTIAATDDTTYNNTNWNCSYTFTHGLEACTAGNATIVGTGEFADYIDLIVIAIVIAVVMGLILAIGFARRVR